MTAQIRIASADSAPRVDKGERCMRDVLVVIDMQNDFITGPLGSSMAKSIVPKVVKKIREFDGLVLATQDTHDDLYLDSQEGKMLPAPHCISGSEGWNLHPYVQKAIYRRHDLSVRDPIIQKNTFGSILLADFLSDMNEKGELGDVTLIGVCTDICVASNAILLKTFLPEVKIIVDAACCASITENRHDAALRTMRSCQIIVQNYFLFNRNI